MALKRSVRETSVLSSALSSLALRPVRLSYYRSRGEAPADRCHWRQIVCGIPPEVRTTVKFQNYHCVRYTVLNHCIVFLVLPLFALFPCHTIQIVVCRSEVAVSLTL